MGVHACDPMHTFSVSFCTCICISIEVARVTRSGPVAWPGGPGQSPQESRMNLDECRCWMSLSKKARIGPDRRYESPEQV